MPYQLIYVPAEIFLEHKGVTIYHVYKDNDPDQGAREAWFDINEDSRDEAGFYLPQIEMKLAELGVPFDLNGADQDEQDRTTIRLAIDAGLIKAKKRPTRRPRSQPSNLQVPRKSNGT